MYPFHAGPTMVRDRWYVAAFSEEITRQPMERTLLGVPVVLYRSEAGPPVAMYGICPHRYYPLALGHLEGDRLVCGYHGFAFASDGKCIRIPAQGSGANFVQPTYPVMERGPLVWIWMGRPERCDPELIPPYADFGLGEPGWAECAHSYFRIEGRHQLLIDNLMDLTHLPFLHTQLPIGDAFLQPRLESEQRVRSFQLRRPSRSAWTPFHDLLYTPAARFEGISDIVSITDFYGPELIRTSGPVTSSVDGMDRVPAEIGTLWILHGITPEADRTTHYFGIMVRDFRTDDRDLDATLLRTTTGVRQQDVDAIEAVETRLEASAARQPELLAKADVPAARVRRIIQAMLVEEQPT